MSNAVRAALLLAAAILSRAQSVEIFSEFQRPDPFGGIVQADRAYRPREILSPAVARGGHATFHVAVSVPPKESYLLYVVTNPVDACRVSLFKEHFVPTKDGWIPDRLTELHQLPDFGAMPDPEDHIEGQTTRAYLLDIWIPPDATSGRFRLEVQLKVAEWVVRPLEIRVEPPVVPALPKGPGGPMPQIDKPADSAVFAALNTYTAGGKPAAGAEPKTVREFIRRNAVQDMVLAASLDESVASPGAIQRRALDLLRMNAAVRPRPFGAEWYLKMRDFLLARR